MTTTSKPDSLFTYPTAPQLPPPGSRPLHVADVARQPNYHEEPTATRRNNNNISSSISSSSSILNSATLQCPLEVVSLIRGSIAQQPTLQEELTGLNSASLRAFFDTADRRERDTARRVVEAECQRRIQQYKSLADVHSGTSCLTTGQQRHYKPLVEAFLRDPSRPPGSSDVYPDTALVLSLVQREQDAYHDSLKRTTCSCTECAKKQQQQTSDEGWGDDEDAEVGGGDDHVCHNYNFLDRAHVLPFLRLWRRRNMAQHLTAFLALAKSSSGGDNHNYNQQQQASEGEETRTVVVSHTGRSFAQAYYDGAAPVVVTSAPHVAAVLPRSSSTSPPLKAKGKGKTAKRARGGEAEVEEAVSQHPAAASCLSTPHKLDVSLLLKHTGEEEVDGEAAAWSRMMESAAHQTVPRAMMLPRSATSPSPSAAASSGGSSVSRVASYSLTLHMEALFTLLTAHISEEITGGKCGFRLPLRIQFARDANKTMKTKTTGGDDGEGSRYNLCMDIGPPIPREIVRRRDCVAAAMSALLDAEEEAPATTTTTATRGANKGRCGTELTLHAPLSSADGKGDHPQHPITIRVVGGECHTDDHNKPQFRMVKTNYLPQPPAATMPSSSSSPNEEQVTDNNNNNTARYLLESFSRHEVLRIEMLLRCHPDAEVHVYYVDAFTATVLHIQKLTRASWESFTSQYPSLLNSDDVRCAWNWLYDTLTATGHKVATTLNAQLANASSEEGSTFCFLTRVNDSAHAQRQAEKHHHDAKRSRKCELRLYKATELYPSYTPRHNTEAEAASCCFVEQKHEAINTREYLAPTVWPFTDRIPFTFPLCSVQKVSE